MGRARGRRHNPPGFTDEIRASVRPVNSEKLNAIADRLGVSLGAYIDSLIERDQVDETGRPVWWPEDRLSDHPELFRMTG